MIKLQSLKNYLKIKSLLFKLTLSFVIFITLPLLFNGLLTFTKTRNVLEDRINSYVQSTLSFISSDVSKLIEEYDLNFVDFYSRKKFFTTISEKQVNYTDQLNAEVLINDELDTFLINSTSFHSFYFFSNTGEVYSAAKEGERDYTFVDAYNRNHPLIQELLSLKGDGLWFVLNNNVCLGRVIKNIYGKFDQIGIAVAVIDKKSITDICSDIHVPGDVSLYILNQKNEIVFNKNGYEDISSYINSGQIKNLFKSNTGIEVSAINNTDYAVIYNTSPYNHWKYIELIKETQLTSDIFELQNYYFFITVISILFFIMITYAVSRNIAKPIKKLAQAMNKIKGGNLDIDIQTNNNDEIGVLYDSFNTMRQRIKNLIADIINASQKEKEAEIQALKAQFNPHFLYNALGTVNWVAIKNNQFEISDMLTSLSDLMRYSLDKNSGDIVTIREDIRWLNSYMNFQKMRFDKKFDVIFNVDPFILDQKIHKLLLQPLLENAIMHGLKDSEENGFIIINIRSEADYITIEIKDNGIGIDEERIKIINSDRNEGLGIRNVRERLRLYYGDNYKLIFSSNSQYGTAINLVIPKID